MANFNWILLGNLQYGCIFCTLLCFFFTLPCRRDLYTKLSLQREFDLPMECFNFTSQLRFGSCDQVVANTTENSSLTSKLFAANSRPTFTCKRARRDFRVAIKSGSLTLSLPRVINCKFPLQPHQKYYITQYEEFGFSKLTQMNDEYTTNSHFRKVKYILPTF